MAADNSTLKQINPKNIKPNPDNPRLIFREAELNQLLESIREVGVKVPLSVYPDGDNFVLIDGERRWRCALKLNLQNIPAITQPKPGKLENILMMFNIHNVRVEWDLMPTAIKIGEVKKLLESEGQKATPQKLAGITGVSLPTIRRAYVLLDMPLKYRNMLLKEAEKPKEKQSVTADLFLEINRALNVIESYQPRVFHKFNREQYADALVEKYLEGTIKNIVRFRDISKIARAELAGKNPDIAIPVLIKLVEEKSYTIEKAYQESVESAYERRDLNNKLESIKNLLSEYTRSSEIPEEIIDTLEELHSLIKRLLGK